MPGHRGDRLRRQSRKETNTNLLPLTMLKNMGVLSVLIVASGIVTLGLIILIHSSVEKEKSGISDGAHPLKSQEVRPPDILPCQENKGIWPSDNDGDRIIEQLMFRPPASSLMNDRDETNLNSRDFKKIVYWSYENHNIRHGRGVFQDLKCTVDTCLLYQLGYEDVEPYSADAVIFTQPSGLVEFNHTSSQVWIIYMKESPFFFRVKTKVSFNWTATYKRNSDIVTPYGRWKYHNPDIRQMDEIFNYARGKTKQVAWFVSNCRANNNRLEYALELSKHINVDIFGHCGPQPMSCSRSKTDDCFDILKMDYKFYLSFENSNCRDYITEKFFVNGLSNDVIPVVMGAHPDDYKRVAPEGSYIHVDDFESPKHLAEYLSLLDSSDYLYNQYFRWKWTGEFIETDFLCRVCAILHDSCHEPQHYEDLPNWWGPESTCVEGSWIDDANHNVN